MRFLRVLLRPLRMLMLVACWLVCLPATLTAQGIGQMVDKSNSIANSTEFASPRTCDCCGEACDGPCWCETPVKQYRESFCQGAALVGGHLFDTGDSAGGLDQSYAEARASFGLPLGSMDNILGLRPFFRTEHLRGPTTVNLPSTLYNTGVSILHQKTWTERWSTTVLVTPAVRSDFTTSEKAVRVFGVGLVHWQCKPNLKLSLGVVYFDRADFSILPAAGLSWTPTPWLKFDATLPRPRIAKRLWKDGGYAEGWAYLGGTIGGNTWAVTAPDGLPDEFTIRDIQVLGGYEVIREGNRGFFVEGGVAFARKIEFERLALETELDAGLFLQAGWLF